MTRAASTPVFVGVRVGLDTVFLALGVVVIARAALSPTVASSTVILMTLSFGVTYALGPFSTRTAQAGSLLRAGWVSVLTIECVVLLWLIADAAYLAFPLFFVYLHLLGRWWGAAAILLSTTIAIFALALHKGWTVGGVVGPIVGAGVALLIGLGYRALAREAEQREALVRELIATRGQLAATEHRSGVLAERARLAREIHDTLAQGLSSIQMLLHAAERADPDRPGLEHIRLARETAAGNLTDARRFIRELTPPQLDDQTLGAALRRLARTRWAAEGLDVQVHVSDSVTLPMHLQTALLRIAQGAVANVVQHAHTTTAFITIAHAGDQLHFTVSDRGAGFDPHNGSAETAVKPESFGLRAIRERAQQLGGSLIVDTAPGEGTTLTVQLNREEPA